MDAGWAKRGHIGVLGLLVLVLACETDGETLFVEPDVPAAPAGLSAFYFDRAVHVTWELAAGWSGESFRVYSRRVTDADYFLIAEVTNCSGGLCSYTDVNVEPGVTYQYFVASVSADGTESASPFSVEVSVPFPTPPPTPASMEIVALDGAAFLRWSDESRSADDFSYYRIYLAGAQTDFLLGETDSEGFLDLLAANGSTYTYYVTAVDGDGHESGAGPLASGTPRPDFHNEWLWTVEDLRGASGFRFRADESIDPVVSGSDPGRHFRLETDGAGSWIVPGPGAEIHASAFATTALTCGPGADAGCVALEEAPLEGYLGTAVQALPQSTYVLRVVGDDGLTHYGAVRVTLLGRDQNGDRIMIFDWSYQLQPDNPSLTPPPPGAPGAME